MRGLAVSWLPALRGYPSGPRSLGFLMTPLFGLMVSDLAGSAGGLYDFSPKSSLFLTLPISSTWVPRQLDTHATLLRPPGLPTVLISQVPGRSFLAHPTPSTHTSWLPHLLLFTPTPTYPHATEAERPPTPNTPQPALPSRCLSKRRFAAKPWAGRGEGTGCRTPGCLNPCLCQGKPSILSFPADLCVLPDLLITAQTPVIMEAQLQPDAGQQLASVHYNSISLAAHVFRASGSAGSEKKNCTASRSAQAKNSLPSFPSQAHKTPKFFLNVWKSQGIKTPAVHCNI